ncbi:protein kinase [Isosphaeraceae bacterium EP7]
MAKLDLTVLSSSSSSASSIVEKPEVETPPAPRERPIPAIRGYQILGELGRGGMGVVYLAREVGLNRPCALKMILAGAHADDEAKSRFLAEAEAVARLQHPNIVQIHHVGEADGLPFFELEYVEGGSLDKRLDGNPWPPRRAAELVESLARGVAQAHRLGIVHRDLKPANILIAADGTPKITDFGLARAMNTESDLTATQSVMGSPSYMAPEQAEGKTKGLGPLADVYALGAILYKLLAGRPPFRGAAVQETLEQVKTVEPVPPSRLVHGLPRDIETIALKCLEKEPGKRYDSAEALAADLRRFLDNEPIVARPVPPWERAIKWARRRPSIVSLAVSVFLLLGLLLGLWIWSYAEIHRSLATAERLARTEAVANAIAQDQTKIANQRAEDLAWEDYINRVNRAYGEVQADNIALAEDLLHGCPIERRGWEWHYVNRLCHPERLSVEALGGIVVSIAYSPDGRLIAIGSRGPSSIGKGSSIVELWNRETGQRQQLIHCVENLIWSVRFSPDGTKLAIGGSNPQIEIRDVKTGEILWAEHEPKLPHAMSVAFNPDGKSLAVGFGRFSQDNVHKVTLYEVANGRKTFTFPGPKGGVNDLAFHRDGRHLAVAGSKLVEVWDVVARMRVHEIPGDSRYVYTVAFSPDGKWLAIGGWDRVIKLRDAATGEEQLTLYGHQGFIRDLAFSPDSRSLVSTGEDRSVRLWEIPTGRPIGVFHGHADFVQAVAFAPDGRELASGGLDGTMKVWDRRTSLPVVFDRHTGWVVSLGFRRDGRRVVSEAGPYRLEGDTTMGWDPVTGDPDPAMTGVVPASHGDAYLPPSLFPFEGMPQPVTSPDGTRLARVWVGGDGFLTFDRSKKYAKITVVVLDVATGRVLHTLVGHTADIVAIAFSPDGRRIATASYDRTIKLWDTATGREVFTLRGHTAGLLVVAFSPDGRRIVSGGIDFTARVWDATPLTDDVLRAHDSRNQQRVQAFEELARVTEAAQRAESLARSGRWDLAAAAFSKFVEQEPDSPTLRYSYIRSLAGARDSAGLRRACEDLLSRFGKVNDFVHANSLAWYCVLAPGSVEDYEAPVRLAEYALAAKPVRGRELSGYLMTLGAALYRVGRFEDAARRFDESNRAREDGGDPKGFAFQAMVNHRLRRRDEAKHWLEKLAAYQPKAGSDFSWDDVEIRILRREAEELILGSSSAAASAPPKNTASHHRAETK